jgi:hypothetical protein
LTDIEVVDFVTDLGVQRGLEPGSRIIGVKGVSGSSLKERGDWHFKHSHAPHCFLSSIEMPAHSG